MLRENLQQEPGATDLEVINGIRYVRPGNDFQPKMTLFRRIEVNGSKEHPLFAYLKVRVVRFVYAIISIFKVYKNKTTNKSHMTSLAVPISITRVVNLVLFLFCATCP